MFPMNFDDIRQLFPLFHQKKTILSHTIYLDNAATTQKPLVVVDSMSNFYTTINANVHRGLYPAAEKTTHQFEEARTRIGRFVGTSFPTEIVFTKNTTEAINLVAYSWARHNLTAGDIILLTQAEHHANLIPWIELCKNIGTRLRYIPFNPLTKQFDTTDIALEGVKLFTTHHTSNTVGNAWGKNHEILTHTIKAVKNRGGLVLLDAAQSIAHTPINAQTLDVDFLAFSAHKVYGPTGVGVLYIAQKHHSKLKPFLLGGGMIQHVTFENATWAPMPRLLEAGTPPIAEVIGLKAALDFFEHNISYEILQKHETALCQRFITGLEQLPGITIFSNHAEDNHQHLVSFYHEKIHSHDLAGFLGTKNIAMRAGHHCTQPLLEYHNVPSLVRMSIAVYNTVDEIDTALASLSEAITLLSV